MLYVCRLIATLLKILGIIFVAYFSLTTLDALFHVVVQQDKSCYFVLFGSQS